MSSARNNTSFFSKFTSLFIGLVLVQVVNFLFSLILPKYFSPQEFAEFGIFTSLVFILIEVVNAKLDIAVMLGKNEEETIQILNAAFTFAIMFFLFLFLVVLLLISIIPKVYLLLPFIVILYGIHQPILVYLNKTEKYRTINIFRIIQVITTSVLTIYMAVIQINNALIVGFTAGLAMSTLFGIFIIQPKFDFDDFRCVWKKFDQFPKFGTWSSLFNNISRNSIPVLLAHFFSKQFVGFYTYSTRLLNAPTGMYTSALSQVYFKEASELDKISLKKITQKIIFFNFCAAIMPTLIFLFYGQDIFFHLFNGEWLEAGKVTQYLILWYFLSVIVSPVTSLLDIRNKLKFEFGFNLVLFTARIAAVVTGGLLNNFYLSILLFSVVGVLMNLVLLYYIYLVILKE